MGKTSLMSESSKNKNVLDEKFRKSFLKLFEKLMFKLELKLENRKLCKNLILIARI